MWHLAEGGAVGAVTTSLLARRASPPASEKGTDSREGQEVAETTSNHDSALSNAEQRSSRNSLFPPNFSVLF